MLYLWDDQFGFGFLQRNVEFGMADVQEEKLMCKRKGCCAQGQKS